MADGISGTPGIGVLIAADEIAGSQYQRMKLIHGADGVNAGDVAVANPLPVAIAPALDAPWLGLAFNYNTTGDKVVIPGIALNYIRVYGVFLWVGGATGVYLQNTTPVSLTGLITLIAGGKVEFPIMGRPYFEIAVGLGLGLHIVTDAINVGGVIFYTQNTTP